MHCKREMTAINVDDAAGAGRGSLRQTRRALWPESGSPLENAWPVLEPPKARNFRLTGRDLLAGFLLQSR